MKSPTDARCRHCKDGVCMPIEQSRLEERLGHQSFVCDKCGERYKVTYRPPYLPPRFTKCQKLRSSK